MRSPFAFALLIATVLVLAAPGATALRPDVAEVVVDLRWMTACPGPWGHEERTTVGPVTIVQYVCDDGGT